MTTADRTGAPPATGPERPPTAVESEAVRPWPPRSDPPPGPHLPVVMPAAGFGEKRLLTLAEHLAAKVVTDAHEAATTIVARASEQAESRVATAEAEAGGEVAIAQVRGWDADETSRQVRETGELTVARDRLAAEVRLLEQRTAAGREALDGLLGHLDDLLNGGGPPRPAPATGREQRPELCPPAAGPPRPRPGESGRR